ncbi:MAG: proteasome accessory factor PafA2 family protein [Candidatus Sungbacteria bacterium]|nr:proteasome accessory factor PafA2 family protein [bacterium]MDZ4260114.1 proteasome accessory factor PafA2 family protein [Candidatus Sungbacteria bacterium]
MQFPDRVYGMENEFGVIIKKNGLYLPDTLMMIIAQSLLSPIKHSLASSAQGSSRIWHSNGSCSYVDTGDHPEHASPECRTVRDLVRFVKAGEHLMKEIFSRPVPFSSSEKYLSLYKNNLGCDTKGNIVGEFGCHENYSIFNSFDKSRTHIDALLPFLITRQIIGGSGWWHIDGSYRYSQRAGAMCNDIGTTSASNRPLINLRGDADTGDIHRLQLIFGDANILEFALYLKVGITSLIISLIESGAMPAISCHTPIQTMEVISSSFDPFFPAVYVNNALRSAFEVQAMYLDMVHKVLPDAAFESEETEAEVRDIVLCWERTLNAIEHRDTPWLVGRLDWATKKYLGDAAVARANTTDTSSLHAIKKDIDIYYHSIFDRSLQDYMNKKWPSRRIVSDTEINAAIIDPPHNTRAVLRGAFVKRIAQESPHHKRYIDWNACGDDDLTYSLFKFRNPLIVEHEKFNDFMEHYLRYFTR